MTCLCRCAVLLLLVLSQQALALIPTVCVKNVSEPLSVCCPTPPGFDEPCGGKSRGRCLRLQAYQEYERYHPALAADDRLMWPTRFFDFTCQCDAKFWGADCGECFFGWRGRNCEERDIRLRRNIFTFSDQERRQYQEMTKLMRVKMSPYSVLIERFPNQSDPLREPKFVTATVHYWLVFIHRYASRKTLFADKEVCQKFGKLDLNHGGPGFVTWHRYYTMTLERELHKIAVERFNWTEFGLPYWDWVDATWCEVCNNEIIGSPGECDSYGQRLHHESPFMHWDEFCSSPSNSPTGACVGCHWQDKFNKLTRQWTSLSLPTSDEVEYALSIKDYYIPGEFQKAADDLDNCGFARFLEGHCGPAEFMGTTGTLHNKVHDSVTGSLCCASTAPNDPLFFLHHSQISRIVEMWMLRHRPHEFQMANTDAEPGHGRQSFMVGFFPAIRHEEVFSDNLALGYDYDTLEFGEPVRRRLQQKYRWPLPTWKHFKNCRSDHLLPQYRLHLQHLGEERPKWGHQAEL